jgi:cytoskeletal protein CcmA (bactofilin family)
MTTPTPAAATIIGPDAHIKGEMTFDGSIRILGTFEGKVTSGGTIELGETARCKATVEGVRVVVEGEVEGEIAARETIELKSRAVVRGDIHAESLIVVEGARLNGHCRVGPESASGLGPQTVRTATPAVETRHVRPTAPDHAAAPAAEHREARLPGASDWMRLAKSARAAQQQNQQQRPGDQSAA